ncbi:venom factor [Patella vulgata]|uniref:venom factor n=1 Tax=Patella vulgata TaxID=6465 RepID=UPI00217F314D|nr:venom factor [Patella vulgata]
MVLRILAVETCLILFLGYIKHIDTSRPVYFVVAPNVLKVNIDEVITLTNFGDIEDVRMQVYLQDFPAQLQNFSFREVVVPKDEVANVSIRLTVDDVLMLPSNSHFIYLVAESTSPDKPFKQMTKLLLDYHPGYIFIQTDKPVYTPGQKVNIRIIPLDDDTRPVDWPVQVDIVNPDKVVVSRSKKDGGEPFLIETLEIPDYPVYGNYSVTATFANGVKTSASVRFEVREYVLPIFTVAFDIEEKYQVILPYHTEFKANLQARYVFGKPVRGHVTVSYGLVWHGHIFTLGKQLNIQLSITGDTTITIQIDDLKVASQTMWFPNGGRLFLNAAVTEEASGNVEHYMVQSVVFAKSAHILKFTRCSRYFKPGLPYVLHVDAIRANGQPARHLPVIIEGEGDVKEEKVIITPLISVGEQLSTDADGRLATEILLPAEIKTLKIKIRTNIKGLPLKNQTESLFVAVPYYSPSDTYMSVRALPTSPGKPSAIPSIGDFMTVETMNTEPDLLDYINMLVIAKGKIIHHTRTRALAGDRTNFYIPVTADMSPSARIVTFSLRGTTAGSEVVADATWLDIEEQCDNEVMLETDNGEKTYRPRDEMTITLTGKPNTTIGLLAVDQSVYLIKNKTFSRTKFFADMRANDRGCGSGGGRDSAYVFQGAGLAILTNADMKTETRSSEGCPNKAVRRKRSSEDLIEELCCKKGYEESDAVLQRCFNAAKYVRQSTNSSLCAEEFYRCCKYMVNGVEIVEARLNRHGDKDVQDVLFDDEDVMIDLPLRTNFPESWLFEEHTLGEDGKTELSVGLPDTITTWMLHTVSISKQHGFCVSKPHNVTVFKNFFVHLDLPYSAVRLEQLEVRVTIYNYLNMDLSVKLFIQSVEGVCYSGEPGENSEMAHMDIPPNDAASVSFPLIPLELGLFPIRVFAYSSWGRDAVEKLLYVEGEGLEKIHTVSVMLDPSGKRLIRDKPKNVSIDIKNEVDEVGSRQTVQLDLDLPQNVVPETEKCTVSAIGDVLGPTVSGIINGVDTLLKLPTGCGEQNLIHLAPNVYVMRYLKATGRLQSGVEKKARAFMRQGMMRQLTFKKDDGSFATWPHAESSTWLTAFALKVLNQARSFIPIDTNVTCQALRWILDKQISDGSFREDSWVMHKEMLGGTTGETTLAAFVLISLLESDCKPEDDDYQLKTIEYLESKLEELDRPLAVAMTTYALALSYSPARHRANEILRKLAQTTPEGFVFWGPGEENDFKLGLTPHWFNKEPNALAVEATAYALLAQLEMGEIQYSNQIVGWLLQQRESHGSFVSTQDTVIGLQALSEYSIRTYSAILDMTCHITSEADQNFQRLISLRHEDALVLKSVPKVPTGGKLMFEAAGTGVGMMQVEVRYNIPEEGDSCKFDVTVDSRRLSHMVYQFFNQHARTNCELCSQSCDNAVEEEEEDDYENFKFPDIIPRIQRLNFKTDEEENTNVGSRIGRPFFHIGRTPYNHQRSRRSISARVLCIEVCVRFQGNQETGMSVLDVGLFTGYQPIDNDLNLMKTNGKIQHFETSQRSVILYVEEISHKRTECFKFRAKQKHIVENIQPAKVQVFDYYNPAIRCSYFYKPDNVSGHLTNFCDKQKSICQCLEGRCSQCENIWYGKKWNDIIKYACLNSTYVLQIKVLDKQEESAGFERVLASVQRVIFSSGAIEIKSKDKMILLKRSSCMCPSVEVNKNYIFMAGIPKRFRDDEDNLVYAFLMDKMAVVTEVYKSKQKNISKEQKQMSRQFRRFQKRLLRKRCTRYQKKSRMLHAFPGV